LYQPENYRPDVDVPFNDNDGNEVDVPVTCEFSPVFISPELEVNVPFTVEFSPDISIGGEFNLNTGDINFNVGVDIDVPTPITDPTVEPDGDGPGGNPELPGQPIGQKIIAVVVVTTAISDAYEGTIRETNTTGADFYIPRLGSVSFYCEGLSVPGLFWTEDIDVKYTFQVIECPIPWGALDVRVTGYPGVTFSVGLVRGEPERDLLLRSAGVS
jgi:hypothetical protein